LRDRAVGLLARREHSRRELVRKLISKTRSAGVEAERIECVVDALAEAGLQSDTRAAEMLVRSRIERGQGPLRIRADLRERGLAGETADLLLEAEVDAWPQRLQALIERRFGTDSPPDGREWARQARFLASRGFPESLIRDALERPRD